MLQKLKDKLAEALARRRCAKGKHRWAVALVKDADGSREERFCQTCGEGREKV